MKKIGIILAGLLVCGNVSADPVGGPQYARGILQPDHSTIYSVALVADELTLIGVVGDGDGDIDCALNDDLGNVIDTDLSDKDGCVMTVVPKWTGMFHIFLLNNGQKSSVYNMSVR